MSPRLGRVFGPAVIVDFFLSGHGTRDHVAVFVGQVFSPDRAQVHGFGDTARGDHFEARVGAFDSRDLNIGEPQRFPDAGKCIARQDTCLRFVQVRKHFAKYLSTHHGIFD
jgi:hypothetical protein